MAAFEVTAEAIRARKPPVVWIANRRGHKSTHEFGYYASRLDLMAAHPVVELIFCNHKFSVVCSNLHVKFGE